MGALIEGVRRIAVLRANALGDLVLAMPALEALRRAYPRARLTLLGTPWHARFLDGRPGPVDDVVVLPPISGVSSAVGGHEAPKSLFKELREHRFDLAVQIHGGGRHSNPFIKAIGARVTAGLCTPDAERLDLWVPYVYYQHETLRYLEVAALVGGTAEAYEPRIAVTDADRAELARVYGEPPRGLVALHPGASDPRRRWPARAFAEAADRLGRPIVITGVEKERKVIEEVATAMRRPAVTAVGTLSVGGLAALYERCDLVISNDTGPRHLAAAVGTPTIGIYWSGNLINAGPLTRTRHRALISWTARCPVCGVNGHDLRLARCPHDESWVAEVPVDDVVEQAEDLLRDHRKI
ncbi:LPS biosynthesis-related glycosyltransferase [Microbispora rosea subsp. aerata]|nr:glycosyltransferase family 9 protein [Microbispora rosea]GGO21203.1 LPS biosynthesis-related glycosyltransferase [Microbispora rosea subsp. aerata]GIH56157.1 LPS biosynthesis-related glycosyltransferase [Microbispora rosea subsp. aerata]GLJ85722.1 LPS biosynthesis-related glycosyltransferase [Microbispora rosea subsp. aerata]